MIKRWVTQYVQGLGTDAVAKAKQDVAVISQTMGYNPLPVFLYDDTGETDEALIARIDGITAGMKEEDILLYQYPSKWFGHRFDSTFIRHMKNRRIRVILFIHDIDSFTGGAGTTVEEEVEALNTSAVVITHSDKMSEWLASKGVTTPMLTKDIFDFLLDEGDAPLQDNLERKIVFAGWLPKSVFLSDWQQNVEIEAYGQKGNLTLSEKINYKGEFSQAALIREISKTTFGLCWADDVGGIVHHEYQRYNNPLKISLYLSLGLPVILWNEAATAPFVEKHQIGFSISNIGEIEAKINSLSPEDLQKMKHRTNKFSQLTRNGYFTRKAILEAENIIFQQHLES